MKLDRSAPDWFGGRSLDDLPPFFFQVAGFEIEPNLGGVQEAEAEKETSGKDKAKHESTSKYGIESISFWRIGAENR